MARQDVAVTAGTGPNPTTGAVLTLTAADTVNKEQIALTGKEVIIVQNTGGVGYTYTVTSAADPYGRTLDITAAAIAAGAIHVLGPFSGLTGWIQPADGKLYFEASNVAVKFGVYRLT